MGKTQSSHVVYTLARHTIGIYPIIHSGLTEVGSRH